MKVALKETYKIGCGGCSKFRRCRREPVRVDEYLAFQEDEQQKQLSIYYNCKIIMCAWIHLYDERLSPVLNPPEQQRIKERFQGRLEGAGWTRIEFIESFGKSYL